MRLWSIHPRYLDPAGLVAAWREGLLAKKVLEGGTKGYRHHPQLERFKAAEYPEGAIRRYLSALLDEALCRGYRFDGSKLESPSAGGAAFAEPAARIPVNAGQLAYEFWLLGRKLEARAPERLERLRGVIRIEPNDAFIERPGGVEGWERPLPGFVPPPGASG